MFIITKASLVRSGQINEATIGRFAYGDMETGIVGHLDEPTKRLRRRKSLQGQKGYLLTIEGEILVSKEDMKDYEKQFDIFTPQLPVDEPFQSWTTLIDAVQERTPEARKLLRYLEDFGYQDLLKMRKEVMVRIGDKNVKQVRWDDFLLPPETAQMAGYSNGADYNRKMFQELLKVAPRAAAPEGFDPTKAKGGLFGGRKLMRGATGSKREMKKRVEPMIDHIVAEHRAETITALREIFSVLPEKWCDAMLGGNNENVQYQKDEGASHLGGTVETIPSNRDYLELSRLNRVLSLLKKRSGSADAVQKTKDMIKEKQEAMSGEFEVIYTTIFVRLDGFVVGLSQELSTRGYNQIEGNMLESKTSLQNTPEFISLMEPPGQKVGFKDEFNDLIVDAIESAFGMSAKIITLSKDGTLTFSSEGIPEIEPESPEEKEEFSKARERVMKWKKSKLKGGTKEETIDDIINMIRGEGG